mmetsp:Transcript_11565/g.15639  ORF Transcript_11565/g.15639 Transcript_11565/m.15639 type:complete len:120 (+) Transcript_11565:290-649(+)
MVFPRWAHAVTHLREDLLIVTGTAYAQKFGKKAECYSIGCNQWRMLPDLNKGRAGHASCGFRGRFVFVFCGFLLDDTTSYQATNMIEMIDLQNPNQLDNEDFTWQCIEVNQNSPESAML